MRFEPECTADRVGFGVVDRPIDSTADPSAGAGTPPAAADAASAPGPAAAALAGRRVVVVMPAYNAAKTLERTYADIPHDIVSRIILVDDVSKDETVDVARQLGLDVIIHQQNLGYGGNQKTCYRAALEHGADVVVMLHPDYQYDATRIPDLIAPILSGEKHLMLGSRFLGDPLAGGMPKWKFISNRFLTTVENIAFGLHLSEYHTGLRAYSRRLLETIPYQLNSNDFVFDQELIAQVVAAGMGRRIGEIGVPTRYFDEASSVGFKRSVVYGLSTMRVVLRYLLHRVGVRRSPKLTARTPEPPRPAA
jgi:glycosyltransferase involved in cell wall biosynthesis